MRIIGVDFGESRTGLAVSDPLGITAQGLDTLREKNMEKVAQYVSALAGEYAVAKIVIGLPKNMNGSIGERGKRTKKFAELTQSMTDAEIVLWDERLTSVSAHNVLNDANVRGNKRKGAVDKIAAVLILQNYLDCMKFQNQ